MGNIIDKTKSKMAEFFFKKALKENPIWFNEQFVLANCKNIAFVYDEKNSDFNQLLNRFQKYFKERSKIVAIYKLSVDTVNQNGINDGVSIVDFSTEEVNFYGKPKSPEVLNFLNREFDLLINLSSLDNWPMRFAIAMSNAKFKIAITKSDYINYDLVIPFGDEPQRVNNFDFLYEILVKINGNVTNS